MRVDLRKKAEDQYGVELPNPHFPPPADQRAWPLYEIASSALLSTADKLSVSESLERYVLMRRIMSDAPKGAVEMTTGEAELVKKAVASIYTPLVLGQLHDAIEAGAK